MQILNVNSNIKNRIKKPVLNEITPKKTFTMLRPVRRSKIIAEITRYDLLK